MNFNSYPPPFRQQITNQEAKHKFTDSPDSTESVHDSISLELDPIPIIDLKYPNQLEKQPLGEACKNWGLFRLVNHGIPSTLLTQLQEHTKKLFSLSFESKQALFTSPLSYFYGTPALTPSGTALLRGPKNINWVEGLNIPLSQLSLVQPDDLLSFRYTLLHELSFFFTFIYYFLINK